MESENKQWITLAPEVCSQIPNMKETVSIRKKYPLEARVTVDSHIVINIFGQVLNEL